MCSSMTLCPFIRTSDRIAIYGGCVDVGEITVDVAGIAGDHKQLSALSVFREVGPSPLSRSEHTVLTQAASGSAIGQ